MTATYTRTHTYVTFADPYLRCTECGERAFGFHDPDKCGCEAGSWLVRCLHRAEATSVCPSWSPVDGCCCLEFLGKVEHEVFA